MDVYTTWEKLKNFINEHNLEMIYQDLTNKYHIFCVDGVNCYYTEIWKDTTNIKGIDINQNNLNKEDFEVNYKDTATCL